MLVVLWDATCGIVRVLLVVLKDQLLDGMTDIAWPSRPTACA